MPARNLVGNIGWKLASIALAYVMWLAVVEEPQAIRDIGVPVYFENLPSQLAMVGEERTSSITVRVRASEQVIRILQPPDIEARVDLHSYGEGTHLIRLVPGSPALRAKRSDIEIVEVVPSSLEVTLEPKVTAEIPIIQRTAGSPAEGYQVTSIVLEPSRVGIQGPRSAVERATEARTREIALGGKSESFSIEVGVVVPEPAVEIYTVAQTRARVTITEVVIERTIPGIPLIVTGTDWESRLRKPSTELVVRGPEKLVAGLGPGDVVASVDLAGLEPQRDWYRLPIAFRFNPDALNQRLEVLSKNEAEVRILQKRLEFPPYEETKDG